jgi:gluconokinase
MTFIFMGVCGCGKSTVGQMFAKELGGVFIEGDALHPAENVAKMSAGTPLNDEDRVGWLTNLADAISAGKQTSEIVCASCSALKRSYRDRLMGEKTVFVYLKGSRALLQERMNARTDHFMPPTLLASQFETLEEPDAGSEKVIVLDIARSPEDLVAELRGVLNF